MEALLENVKALQQQQANHTSQIESLNEKTGGLAVSVEDFGEHARLLQNQVGNLSPNSVRDSIDGAISSLKLDATMLPPRTLLFSFSSACPSGYEQLDMASMYFRDRRAEDVLRALGIYGDFNKKDASRTLENAIYKNYNTIRVRACLRKA